MVVILFRIVQLIHFATPFYTTMIQVYILIGIRKPTCMGMTSYLSSSGTNSQCIILLSHWFHLWFKGTSRPRYLKLFRNFKWLIIVHNAWCIFIFARHKNNLCFRAFVCKTLLMPLQAFCTSPEVFANSTIALHSTKAWWLYCDEPKTWGSWNEPKNTVRRRRISKSEFSLT